ncbi:hypothetical protein CERSUDRAFT_128752 [Gelatoporia subvermispora B]|uniref:Nucleolar 27S pre-rRNA processing Urb2/Npa2 C-terminal domain-containing protein n=1 Tax=Ceriporiopsis subvermispora (strain B) TaxID=914234 RepID=M2RS21_CERS8|nr:hypothetical protein CERSUDRAFT_128752 [Gelatoporia subvermispora B]
MTTTQSAQAFIRALKAPSDPPEAGGLPKIDIARRAWDDNTFYVPNKAEAIVDWLLTRLLKDKSKARDVNPILDARYWNLLSDILLSSDLTNTRGIKAWLVPILNRVPVAPVIVAFFSLLQADSPNTSLELFGPVCQCLSVIWPLSVPKFTPETLLECLGAALTFASTCEISLSGPEAGTGQHATRVVRLIVSSYRSSLANASNKKKLYSAFLKTHLLPWLRCVYLKAGPSDFDQGLKTDVFSAGIETVFNLDILRQAGELYCDNALKEALARATSGTAQETLSVIPRLLQAFVHAIKRHRGALFSQGSHQAPADTARQVQASGMAFFSLCNSLLGSSDDNLQSWQMRIDLLSVVQAENLYYTEDEPAAGVLRQSGKLAMDALKQAWQKEHAERTQKALDVLAALVRIDYDLMSPTLPTILPRLAMVPQGGLSVLTYLGLVLDHHAKIRSMLPFMLQLLDAFSTPWLQNTEELPRTVYQLASSGPLLFPTFLDRLAKAVHTYLTPGQLAETADAILEKLRTAYDEFTEAQAQAAADFGDGSRKKRKKDRRESLPATGQADPDWAAVKFSLLSQVVVLCLTSLPLHTVLDDVRQNVQHAIREAITAILPTAVTSACRGEERRHTWAAQLVGAAALRVHYSLVTARRIQFDSLCDKNLRSVMLDAVKSEETMPQLSLEMYRTLLNEVDRETCDSSDVFDSMITRAERYQHGGGWNGRSHSLDVDANHSQLPVALLHLIFERWLPLLDARASPDQLKRLAKLTLSSSSKDAVHNVIRGTTHELTASIVLTRALHNAQLWELHRLRDTILAEVHGRTATLDSDDLQNLLSGPKRAMKQVASSEVTESTAPFEFLLYAPSEYLLRGSRTDFLRRALSADAIVGRPIRSGASPESRPLLIVREFIRRTLLYHGNVEHQGSKEYVHHLIDTPLTPSESLSDTQQRLVEVTVDLVGLHISFFLKSAKKGEDELIAGLIRTLGESFTADSSKANRTLIPRHCLLRFLDIVTSDYNLTDFSEELRNTLLRLHEQIRTTTLPFMLRLASNDDVKSSDQENDDMLNIWSHVLAFRRWLRLDLSDSPVFGGKLIGRLISDADVLHQRSALYVHVLAVLLQETHLSAPTNRNLHLDCVVAAYVTFSRKCDANTLSAIHLHLSTVCKGFASADFGYVLDTIYNALSNPGNFSTQDMDSLVRLSYVLMMSAPEGTLKANQSHTVRCLNLFAHRKQFTTVPSLRREVMEFVSRNTNDRPALIRETDLSSVWSLMGTLLAGTDSHDETTDPAVFQQVVGTVSALVRLRRDLVLLTLPHLGMVLRLLILSLRSLRPQLGKKQSKLVTDTLPQWIEPGAPLGAEDSKALARLMTTLTTKTLVRTHGTSAQEQKPESLARPFSKHAAYVLTAYIQAMNDPLCFMSAPIRRELQPGLFALCDMMGEHDRDAMMVTLDAGGKATLKALWREYEKQRYVGKG